MKKALLFLLLSFPLLVFSQIKIPEGYTVLKESPSNGKKMEPIMILFDHDSVKDTALIVQNESEFSKYKLLIGLSSLKKQYEIDVLSTSGFSIYPLQLKARKKVIEYGYYEDGTAAFGRFIKLRFNAKRNTIQVIGYDSESKVAPSEYLNKSYNLLTGQYILKRTTFNQANEKVVKEFSGKNTHFKNKVFIENLDLEMLSNLEGIGE